MSAYEEELSRHGERDIDPIMEIVEALPQSPLMENSHVFYRWFSLVYAHTLRADLYFV